jgi:hypothetical protein
VGAIGTVDHAVEVCSLDCLSTADGTGVSWLGMSDASLTQEEADALMAMEKRCAEDKDWSFPPPGDKLIIPLESTDKREPFLLDITRGRIKLAQATYQNRARVAVVLKRLDLSGPPHVNPDGVEMPCPHIHVYRAGWGTKWAYPLPASYPDDASLLDVLVLFLAECNVVEPPRIQSGLF